MLFVVSVLPGPYVLFAPLRAAFLPLLNKLPILLYLTNLSIYGTIGIVGAYQILVPAILILPAL